MIVSFLQNEKKLNKPIGIDNIGDLLCKFLLYYGANNDTNFVNVINLNLQWAPASPCDLIIVDPLNTKNNVGKSTFHYFSIKAAFLIALQALIEECPCGCHYTITNTNNRCLSQNTFHNALKKMFNGVKRGFPKSINNS